ncbi:MAG: type I secretion protein TolC, partial [Gammaproteobacteria bacterium]|nr:type I secretion protein TolC [Gammaproteobacteria bacterium]
MNRKQLCLVVAALLGVRVVAAEDLVQIFELAEGQDPVLKGSEASYAAVRELRPQARARLALPVIGAT